MLHTQVDSIVRALHKQLRDRSVKTRQGCFALLTSVITVLPGALDNHVGAIIPGILYCLRQVCDVIVFVWMGGVFSFPFLLSLVILYILFVSSPLPLPLHPFFLSPFFLLLSCT